MKVLYIGGTGEISYACVQRSVELGHEVAVFNRGRRAEPLPAGVRQIVGDIRDAAAYAALGKENWDAVCQFLGLELPTVERDVAVFWGKCDQYVFISSASAYQKPPKALVVTEDTPLENPYWPYSQAKIAMERYLRDRHAAGAVRLTIVRPSHTYRASFPGGIAKGDDWAWRMLHGRPVIVHGDGTDLWTFTYATDFAVPFCNLLGNARAVGEAFHITRHMESYTWDRIFLAMADALGVEARLAHVPVARIVEYKPYWGAPLLGDKAWSVLYDNSKVMSVAGGFTCKVALEEGMKRAAGHYAKRAAAYKPNDELHAELDRVAEDLAARGG